MPSPQRCPLPDVAVGGSCGDAAKTWGLDSGHSTGEPASDLDSMISEIKEIQTKKKKNWLLWGWGSR